jgi:hypothetical protein
MTFDAQKRRISDLEAMIDVAVGYINSGNPGLAIIVLIGSKDNYLRPLAAAVWPCPECYGTIYHSERCPRNLAKL